jgi:flavin reductase (DIM6/NTAB) family NADH-FMN oxidoreductase RutF/DNA-binding IclR family transcriptional regulator
VAVTEPVPDSNRAAGSALDVDPRWFRHVLGRYPTGVSVVTSIDVDDSAVGLAVGTFTSVSLDPPLVGFLPGRASESWPKIQRAGRFCVNVLSERQEDVCRIFATKEPDKFRDLRWRGTGSGAPIIDGVVAWLDCELETVHEAGDHFIVIGRVLELDVESSDPPLLFFQGGYGSFMARSLASGDMSLSAELSLVDTARGEMEQLARELDARCLAVALVGDELVMMASAGRLGRGRPDFIGERSPAIPAAGTSFMAWAEPEVVERWLSHVESPAEREEWLQRLAEIRVRGYSVALRGEAHPEYERLLDENGFSADAQLTEHARRVLAALPYDPLGFSLEREASEVRSLHAPVFGPDGRVRLTLSLFLGSRQPREGADIQRYGARLTEGVDRVTAAAGSVRPGA